MQFDKEKPSFINGLINKLQIEDEIEYLQYGEEHEYELFNFDWGNLESSAWTNYPSRYKFTGLEILLNFDLVIYNRETYDTLQWLGDLGGLNDALSVFGRVAVSGFAAFNSGSFLVSQLYSQSSPKY